MRAKMDVLGMNGCPWDARENGCPWDEETSVIAEVVCAYTETCHLEVTSSVWNMRAKTDALGMKKCSTPQWTKRRPTPTPEKLVIILRVH